MNRLFQFIRFNAALSNFYGCAIQFFCRLGLDRTGPIGSFIATATLGLAFIVSSNESIVLMWWPAWVEVRWPGARSAVVAMLKSL